MFFRKKQELVEAVQFDGTANHAAELIATLEIPDGRFLTGALHMPRTGAIAGARWWILKDAAGKFSVCSPSQFDELYESMGDNYVLS